MRQLFSCLLGRGLSWPRIIFSWAAVALLAAPLQTVAQDEGQPADAADVPVERVVLFSSGVGYFEHRGQVEGDATIDLKFNVDDINDLLKSMVLQDLDGGQISTVTYGSRDPITKTLQTFAIDLTSNPTLGQLLSQIRGERVEIDAPNKVRGTIVGVEKQRQTSGPDHVVIEVEYLNLLTDEGLRRIPLDAIGRIKLANAELDKEFRQALAVLAAGHATDKKTVSIKFLGEGERNVRVGYIQEAPVWKTSYRLVLDEDDKPLLQGWAIVENTTETDWQDVRLSLVSGRPISFVMDLYSPLYAQRPTVVPEQYASLRPQVYEQDLEAKIARGEGEAQSSRPRYSDEQLRAMSRREGKSVSREMMPQSGGVGGGEAGLSGLVNDADYHIAGTELRSSLVRDSVQAAAQGADVGELFQYNIKNEVTLARQRSAMLPIINDEVAGEKVSIYNAAVHEKYPLNGVRLNNTSDLHLMHGPVTVVDGGVSAGDARIPDLPAGGERLLSYAMDLEIEVAPKRESRPQHLISVRIENGVLQARLKQSRKQNYTLKSSGEESRSVLVEYPIEAGWELVAPKEPSEKTRDVYRFAVEVEPAKPTELTIEEEQTIRQAIAINTLPENGFKYYLGADAVSQAVKQALGEVVRRKRELADLQRRMQQNDQEIGQIREEQERIRANMQSIDRNTDLYNRYVKKFSDQEDRVEELREENRALQQEIANAQRSLEEYISTLNLP